MTILATPAAFASQVPVAIVGGGACGMVAALTLADAGIDCVVLERDAVPQGSTALSSGFIPACHTRWQRALGIADSAEMLAADVERKNHHGSDPAVTRAVAGASGATLEWLADRHGIPFHVLDGFLYPGHSVARMHAVPEKTGAGLIGRLAQAAERAGVALLTEARASALFADGDRVTGVRIERPDGGIEDIGCATVLLACNGYGGNRDMVRRHIPEIADAIYAGHAGNQGDAVLWGEALGAVPSDMGAYQGHGSWAVPHGALVTWALMMEGGIQVNLDARRFWNEHEGYSEASQHVIAEREGLAWNVYDERLHRLGLTFPDYAELFRTGAMKTGATIAALAAQCGLDADALAGTVDAVAGFARGAGACPFGRDFRAKPALSAPFYAVKVTGALFHTQGGLAIDTRGRVVRRDGGTFPNLYAGGGAARGLSGGAVWGYLSGNGLLSAVTLGRLAALDIAARG
ncbi:MAG: FAD-dependent oxidoreductase [Burkholderiales bacterium]|nr:FAD-dependent oxidoreductase [Burkholderiales bacterium]